jgi:predicted outer membrane repeat protein
MKRSCLFPVITLLIFILPNLLSAQVHIADSLSGILTDTTYFVDDSIYVLAGDSLIIEPGAVLLFNGYFNFRIYGYLYAVGTATDSIYFGPAPGVDSPRAIVFLDSSDDSSILSYCYITGFTESAVNAYNCNITISHCTITNNSANWGGGIYCSFSYATITECVITNNQSRNNGGGIYCTYSSPTITDCFISGNVCNLLPTTNSGRGGGGLCANHYSASPIISGCVIINNHSLGYGGGISLNDNTNPLISNCLIADNSCDSSGGGIAVSAACSPTILNCTISKDSADFFGGGVYLYQSSPIIKNSIISSCVGSGALYLDSLSLPVINYSDFFNPATQNFRGAVPDTLGTLAAVNANGDSCDLFYNILLDPLFLNTSDADYHLQAGSPCIDAGDPASPLDPDGTVADMGAYYFYHVLPPVAIDLQPINPPITIPAVGGTYSYFAFAHNTTSSAQPCRVWSKIKYPNGAWTGYVLGPLNLNIPASLNLSRLRNQNVPGSWPGGSYQHWGWVAPAGTFNAYDSSFFTWIKTGVDLDSPLQSWAGGGENFDEFIGGTRSVASNGDMTEHVPPTISPNPFNATTVAIYKLRAASHVSLKVYDTTGRLVATLVEGWRDAGEHQVTFDGSKLVSGVYPYRLTSSGSETTPTTVTGKLVLLK